jgi:hypothetical protein
MAGRPRDQAGRSPLAPRVTIGLPSSAGLTMVRVLRAPLRLSTYLMGSLVSKWFCNTSTGTATRAARCGSCIGVGFGLLVASFG